MTRASRPFPWETVLDRLTAFYGKGDWRVPYLRDHAEDPFQVLIGTILSQRTRDANTDRASAALFARYPDAARLARAPIAEIQKLIRPVGFYRTKARNVRACAQAIREQEGGRVPVDLERLLALPGVGPKTANCVIVFGYGEPGMPVDTHVHRIANRWGIVRTKTPEQTEAALRANVPVEYWIPLNPLLVQHGQNLCRPRNPRCPECPILDVCPTGQARARGGPTPRADDRVRGAPARPARVAGRGVRRNRRSPARAIAPPRARTRRAR
jgi:endonuclease-3